MTDMETLYKYWDETCSKYYDAVRTGDPDRQVNDGVDIKALEFAIQRIAELEQRITELAQQVRIRGERMELMREWLDGSDTYTMSGYDWPRLKSWFDDNGKAL